MARNVEMTLKQFELWTKVKEIGMFVVQERPKCVDTVAAYSLEQAQREAPAGHWVVGKIGN